MHLREIGKPYAQASPLTGDLIARGEPAERVNIPAAWLTADELENELAGWIRATLEDAGEPWSTRSCSWPSLASRSGRLPGQLLVKVGMAVVAALVLRGRRKR